MFAKRLGLVRLVVQALLSVVRAVLLSTRTGCEQNSRQTGERAYKVQLNSVFYFLSLLSSSHDNFYSFSFILKVDQSGLHVQDR